MIETSAVVQKTQDEEAVWALIDGLNLDPIKIKLMSKEEGIGWTREEADRVEVEYKRFLFLIYKYPEKPVVPSKDIDLFWHQHILDTHMYEEDCQRIFGFFLHHFPYFGMRGEDDAINLRNSFLETLDLYQEEFGSVPKNANESTCEPSDCGHSGTCNTCKAENAPSLNPSIRPTFEMIGQ